MRRIMGRKKLAALVCAVCLILLTACGNQVGQQPAQTNEPILSSETQDTPQSESPVTESEPAPSAPEIVGQTPEEESVSLLALDKTCQTHGEWHDQYPVLLAQTSAAQITLSQKYAEKYPELTEVLSQSAVMQKNAMEDEFDNLVSFAREEYAVREVFPEYSKLDVQVRRADSAAVSLLADSSADYARIFGRWLHGTTFDTQTGQELKLSDVIRDLSEIPSLVTVEMNDQMSMIELFDENAVSDYFSRTPEDGISWTLDYNGVTFYFMPGDISEDGIIACATIPFAGHSGLFYEKYTAVPDAYMVALPVNASYFSDLDGDGQLDEIMLTATEAEAFAYEGDIPYYTGFGIHTDMNDHDYYEDMLAYGFHPYYVKAAGGASYLYIFYDRLNNEGRVMGLKVLRLENGTIKKVGEMDAGPHCKPSDSLSDEVFAVPTNPDEFYLDHFENGFDSTPEAAAYRVGGDGMPIQK